MVDRNIEFGLAVELLYEQLTTFDQWLEVYNYSESGSELEKLAFQKMSELAETFEQWLEVSSRVP